MLISPFLYYTSINYIRLLFNFGRISGTHPYFRRKRSINLFGIVDDGGTGNSVQTNMLYDQTTAGFGSSEVVSMLYLFLVHKRHHFDSDTENIFPC